MKYRTKPVVVEAMQYVGTNFLELNEWSNHQVKVDIRSHSNKVVIPTLEGGMEVSLGDYVIKGIQGEFYPCKPDIFEATYEKANESEKIEIALTVGGKEFGKAVVDASNKLQKENSNECGLAI